MRAKSKHIVRVFNPDNEPSVKDMLSQEQASNPQVKSVSCRWRYGLVQTVKGVFCITNDGFGLNQNVERSGAPVYFYRDNDPRSFKTAIFTLSECVSLMTGEQVPLDEFILPNEDVSFENWERRLSR